MRRMALVCLLASAVGAMVSSGAIEDEVDPRVRTYVWPQRLVWQTPPGGYGKRFEIIKPEALIEDSYAQRHVSLIWKSPGCELVNNGDPAGVLLDFGREIHG